MEGNNCCFTQQTLFKFRSSSGVGWLLIKGKWKICTHYGFYPQTHWHILCKNSIMEQKLLGHLSNTSSWINWIFEKGRLIRPDSHWNIKLYIVKMDGWIFFLGGGVGLGFLSKSLKLLLKVTKVTTGHQKLSNIS